MSGKGSAPRPMPDYEKYSDNFDLIFGKKNVQNNPSAKCALAQYQAKSQDKEKKDSQSTNA